MVARNRYLDDADNRTGLTKAKMMWREEDDDGVVGFGRRW
jgi:hypothetical protein